MPIFRDDKEGTKLAAEVKEQAEVVRKLSDEMKMLRKEVEFLSTLSRRNEENILKHEKIVQEISEKFKHLFKILELNEKEV